MKCPYCKTENDGDFRCSFCQVELMKERPKIKHFISFDGFKTYDELNKFHTYDLLKLLKEVRKQRSEVFNLLRMGLKLSETLEEAEELKKESEGDYVRFTAYKNLIEEILIDRVGYKPKRVDEKLLITWANRIGLEDY